MTEPDLIADDLDLDNPNQDPQEKIELARRRIRELKDSLEDKRSDVEKLRKQNEALSQQRKVSNILLRSFLLR